MPKSQKGKHIRIREGFPKQRLVVLPANVLERCRKLPLVSQLFVTDVGCYPSAPHHYVERDQGCAQAILIYCLAGKGTLTLNHITHAVHPGYALFIPPNTPHSYAAEETDPWSLFWIHFEGEHVSDTLASLQIESDNPLLYVPDIHLINNAFENVFACLNYHYSDGGLLAMTSEFMRLLSKIKLHQSHVEIQKQAVEKRVLDTLVFMQEHLDMSLTLKELATHAGQSIPHYSKLFKERMNQSPMAYYLQLKIRKACELLTQTDLSIRDIAAALGYHDPYYFSRLFKKIQGSSPMHYRQYPKR